MGRRIYAAERPDTISPIMVPAAHRNIFMSPSRSPETRRALRKHKTAAANDPDEIVPNTRERERSGTLGLYQYKVA